MKSGTTLWERKRDDGAEQPPCKRQQTGSTPDTRNIQDDDNSERQDLLFEYWYDVIDRNVDKDLQVEPAEVTRERLHNQIWMVCPAH